MIENNTCLPIEKEEKENTNQEKYAKNINPEIIKGRGFLVITWAHITPGGQGACDRLTNLTETKLIPAKNIRIAIFIALE